MPASPELPPLPEGTKGRLKAPKAFELYAEALLQEWIARQASPPVRRAESANAWFKREAYRLITHYLDNDLAHVFSGVAKADRRPRKLVEDALKNPFKLGLLAMFADESPMTRSNRHVFGNQMLYAWAHDVPPDFLNAFLAVSGGPAQIATMLRDKEPEPGFEHRFIIERLCGSSLASSASESQETL